MLSLTPLSPASSGRRTGRVPVQDVIPANRLLLRDLLDAWRIDYRLITAPSQLGEIRDHYFACRDAGKPGAALIAEGKA